MVWQANADWSVTVAELPLQKALPIGDPERKITSGATVYLREIQRFPMLERQEEYRLAKRWREHGDREAAHRLVTSHLRLVAKIAMGYRGYGLPISEVISEGNVGLMQAVKRFEPEKGFRLTTYAMWWIKAAIQEYVLRSWSLVKMATTANQRKLFFNLRKAKSKIAALDEGDMRSDQVKTVARWLGVTETDVIQMNRRLGGDASLNAPIRGDGNSGEWQDWLVDERDSQETTLAETEELDTRRKALSEALAVLNDRERRIFHARRLAEDPIALRTLADEFGVSRERVRQIEVRAFEKVQKAVKNRVGRLNGALHMESYPKFHNEVGVPIVRIGCRKFKCIGDKPPQDHPHIYLNMGDTGEIVCPYCSTLFRFDPSLGAHEADPPDCAHGDVD